MDVEVIKAIGDHILPGVALIVFVWFMFRG
jgi:hypothetical protein